MTPSTSSRLVIVSKLDLGKDDTNYRVVLSRGKQFARGELGEWILGSLYPTKTLTSKFPKQITRTEYERITKELDAAGLEYSQHPRGERVVLFLAAFQTAPGSARIGFTAISPAGVGQVGHKELGNYLSMGIPAGQWQVEVLKVSMPKAKADIPLEIRAFTNELQSLVR